MASYHVVRITCQQNIPTASNDYSWLAYATEHDPATTLDNKPQATRPSCAKGGSLAVLIDEFLFHAVPLEKHLHWTLMLIDAQKLPCSARLVETGSKHSRPDRRNSGAPQQLVFRTNEAGSRTLKTNNLSILLKLAHRSLKLLFPRPSQYRSGE